MTARFLNSITGGVTFTPWNIGHIPQDEIDELYQWRDLSAKNAEFETQRLEREEMERDGQH